MTVITPNEHPEHEKLDKIRHKSQAVGEFLDWLAEEKGVRLCTLQKVEEFSGRQYWPIRVSNQEIIAEFFDIDLDKLDKEKQEMLDSLRKAGF